jgi:hypothetical protein
MTRQAHYFEETVYVPIDEEQEREQRLVELLLAQLEALDKHHMNLVSYTIVK